MHLKAFYESFHVLSEVIGNAINDILKDASLTADLYERINVLLDNQEQLVTLNSVLENLGKEIKTLSEDEKTRSLSQVAVEGLDAILLTLMDLAHAYSDIDMQLLANMTSENGKGLSGIRQSYLGAEKELKAIHGQLNIRPCLIACHATMHLFSALFPRLIRQDIQPWDPLPVMQGGFPSVILGTLGHRPPDGIYTSKQFR